MAISDLFNNSNLTTFGSGGIAKSYASVSGKKPGYSPLQSTLQKGISAALGNTFQGQVQNVLKQTTATQQGLPPGAQPGGLEAVTAPSAFEATEGLRKAYDANMAAAAKPAQETTGGANVSISPDGSINIDTSATPAAATETPPTTTATTPAEETTLPTGVAESETVPSSAPTTAAEADTLEGIYEADDFKAYRDQLAKAYGLQTDQALAKTAQMYDAARKRLSATGGRGFSAAYASLSGELTRDQLRAMSEVTNSSEMQMANDLATAMYAERQFTSEDKRWQQQFEEGKRQFDTQLQANVNQWAVENTLNRDQLSAQISQWEAQNNISLEANGISRLQVENAFTLGQDQLAAQVKQWAEQLGLDNKQLDAQIAQWAAQNGLSQLEIENAFTLGQDQLQAQIDQWAAQLGFDRTQLTAQINEWKNQRLLGEKQLMAQVEQWKAQNTISQGQLDALYYQIDKETQRFYAGLNLDYERLDKQVEQWGVENGLSQQQIDQVRSQIKQDATQFAQTLDLENRALELQKNVAAFQTTMQTLDFFATAVPEMAGYLIEGFVSNLGGGILTGFGEDTGQRIQDAMPEIVGKFYVENYGDSFTDEASLRDALNKALSGYEVDPKKEDGTSIHGSAAAYKEWVINGLVSQWKAVSGGGAQTALTMPENAGSIIYNVGSNSLFGSSNETLRIQNYIKQNLSSWDLKNDMVGAAISLGDWMYENKGSLGLTGQSASAVLGNSNKRIEAAQAILSALFAGGSGNSGPQPPATPLPFSIGT